MALDHALEGIRINAVCPGDTFVTRWIQRDIDNVLTDDEKEKGIIPPDSEIEKRLRVSEEIPMGRVGHVKEIANVVLFLANSSSSFVTGVCLPVDGGNTAQ
eukprot:TRINITY_DN8162_c0_g1_i2.p1 TRINITY_DN8162_c0_g1~~TRINITY_DN8162_c0_g1_i2.p1  ORF type:complete len:101 (+),score=25.53 TRINITY_DN8162_c0_g1_i2:72-374(+)